MHKLIACIYNPVNESQKNAVRAEILSEVYLGKKGKGGRIQKSDLRKLKPLSFSFVDKKIIILDEVMIMPP